MITKSNDRVFIENGLDQKYVYYQTQVHPQEYQADMTAILGFVLKHDDSVNDRTEVSLNMFQTFPLKTQNSTQPTLF